MGGSKSKQESKIPAPTGTASTVHKKNYIAYLNASNEVIALYKINDKGGVALLSGKEANKAYSRHFKH